MKQSIVVTTIFPPSHAIRKFSEYEDWNVVVIGDLKTPKDWACANVTYLGPENQVDLYESLSSLLPWNAYTRKNLGYLQAIKDGAEIIYDTDDDNIPLANWVQHPEFIIESEVLSNIDFVNIYSFFTTKKVWPRGFPLNRIQDSNTLTSSIQREVNVGVWQHLADEDPDVDAIYRLTDNAPIYFEGRPPLVLSANSVCPFNSQNTYFRREVFPLLYLPSTVTFRFTDILRGLIAQPIMWASGFYLAFGEATVLQKRNIHDYLKDFESEIPCYLLSEQVAEIAKANVQANTSISDNLFSVYQALAKAKIVESRELQILEHWLYSLNQ